LASESPSSSPLGSTSFDRRNVRYEDIHAIRDEDFDAMVRMARIEDGLRILDCGCGYGACTRELLKRLGSEQSIEVDLLDRSAPQLARSEGELSSWEHDPRVTLRRIHGDFPRDLPPGVRYDRIVAKMMLHENPEVLQTAIVRSMRDHLRPGGVLVLWDLSLSIATAEFFRQVIRWKDELVGNDTFVRDRHLPSVEELHKRIEEGGLEVVGRPHPIDYQIDTAIRLRTEFVGRRPHYDEWLLRARRLAATLPEATRQELQVHDNGDAVRFRISKVILAARRLS